MLQLELILLCYSFISVVFRAQAPSQPSSLPLQSSPVFSCSPLLLYWAVPSHSPRFLSSQPGPAHHQSSSHCRCSARRAPGPWCGSGTRRNTKGHTGKCRSCPVTPVPRSIPPSPGCGSNAAVNEAGRGKEQSGCYPSGGQGSNSEQPWKVCKQLEITELKFS